MRNSILKSLVAMLSALIMGGGIAVADDVYSPVSPPEPQVPESYMYYNLKVVAQPAEIAKASGTGRYKEGTRVSVNTSVDDTDYVFKRWELDGVAVSSNRYFYHTMGNADQTLTAVYELKEYSPVSPSDPQAPVFPEKETYWKLNLDCEPAESCSFNLNNGSLHEEGDRFMIIAYPSQNFVFDGWYVDDVLVAESLNMYYTMPGEDLSLVARFTYRPVSPDDPAGGNQDNVDNSIHYDVNGDGVVNEDDVTILLEYYLSEKPYIKKYDFNGDGVINVADVDALLPK